MPLFPIGVLLCIESNFKTLYGKNTLFMYFPNSFKNAPILVLETAVVLVSETTKIENNTLPTHTHIALLPPWPKVSDPLYLLSSPWILLFFFHTDYTPWTLLWVRTAPCQRIVQDKWLQSKAVYWAKVNCFDFLHVRCQTTCEVFPVGLFYISVALSKSALCHYWALSFSTIPFFFSYSCAFTVIL